MSIPSWPVSLPQTLFIEGYKQSLPDVTMKSDMDAGPAKVRRRFTAGVTPVSGTQKYTAAQLSTFQSFFEDTLLGGSLRFSWTKPPAHTEACEMRFTAAPTFTALGDGIYQVELALEVLP